MDVSILIATRNRAEALGTTLSAIGNLPCERSAEVIVVDNASTDETAEAVAAVECATMPVRYVYEARRGKGYALNTAIEASTGRALLFTDDDVRPPAHWVERMCDPILNGDADAVAGAIRLAEHLEAPWVQPLKHWLACCEPWRPGGEVSFMCGANMAVGRHVLKCVAGFDPELGPGGPAGALVDTLLFRQLKEAGFRIVPARDAAVDHHMEPWKLTRQGFLDYAERRGRGEAYIAYHWDHARYKWPRLKLGWAYAKLTTRRVHRVLGHKRGSIDPRELILVKKVANCRERLKMKGTPRKYRRHGERKLEAPESHPNAAVA